MLIVDRIVENYAICEDSERNMVEMPLSELPDGVTEGDCLTVLAGGGYRIDTEATRKRRQAARELLDHLLDKSARKSE